MVLKIGVSRGHGKYTAGKRSPNGEREWYFNDTVADAFINMMKQYDDVKIIEVSDPSGEVDTGLIARTDYANKQGVDVYIAFHHNAYQGKWFSGGGSEVHVRPNAPQSYKLASIVAPMVSKAMGRPDRGVKVTNLHETREPNQLAILVEGGFMDSKQDIVAMRDKNKLRAQGEAVAQGVVEYFGLKRGKAPAPSKAASTASVSKSTGGYKAEDTPNSIRVEKGDTLYSIAEKYGLTVEYLKQRNNMKDSEIIVGQTLYVDYDQFKNRGRSTEGSYVMGKIDDLGATIHNRYGSQKKRFNFKDAKLEPLAPGTEVHIFETHEGWGRIYTSRTSGDKSNRWIWLERMIPVEIFKD